MKASRKVLGLITGDGTREERHPIMTPVEHPEQQLRGHTNQSPVENGIELSTNYDTVQVAPLPIVALQDPEGGYIGPAALPQRPWEAPGGGGRGEGARPVRTHRPRPQTLTTTVNPLNLWWGCCGRCGWWWSRGGGGGSWNGDERSLVLLSAALLVLVLALLSTLFILSTGVWRRSNICTSATCVKTAGQILRSLNEKVSPCEDFTEFACGGWLREHPIPEGRYRWGVFDALDQQTLLDLRGLLEEEARPEEPVTIQTVKTVYRACVDDAQWDSVGVAPLLRLVGREGGLPMVDPHWTGHQYRVVTSLATLRRTLGGRSLISLTVEPDAYNTSLPVVYISEGVLPMRRDYILSDNASHKLRQISYLRQLGHELLKELRQETNLTYLDTLYRDVDDLWDFYVKVAELTRPNSQAEDPQEHYEPMTVQELQALTDGVNSSFRMDWLEYLRQVFQDTNVTISAEEKVIVDNSSYLTGLVHLLHHTPKRTVANYLLFPVVVQMGQETSVSYLTRPPTWSLGRAKPRPWHDCTLKARVLLPLGAASVYVRHLYQQQLGPRAREVVKDVSDAFRGMLTSSSWMDADTLREALSKLDRMLRLVAFPQLVLSDHLLDQHHLGLPRVSVSDHFGNMLSLVAWHSRRSLLELRVPATRDKWPRGPLETNAFYSPLHNSIVIPVAVLQPPIFHQEKITGLNYGSLGSIIGHEITHGFDNNGRLRDWTGALKGWWINSTLQDYTNRTSCFVQQYSDYDVASIMPPLDRPDHPMKVNGGITKTENVADNEGLRAAWAAYRSRLEKDGEVVDLPGLEHYTQDQLFFIGFSKIWCTRYTRFAQEFLLATDPHAPTHYRILGSLHNSQEFSRAFNCPPDSPMNPSRKCLLW